MREHSQNTKKNSIDYLVEDVEYLSAIEVNTRISDVVKALKGDYKSRRAADALLVKRDAFDHEAEVRVIVHDQKLTSKVKQKPFLRVRVDPSVLIDSIFFDPRADDAFIKMCTYYLEKSLNFQGVIKKSALYRTREPIVVE